MLLLNLHFYKPPPMLREDISWTVSVEKGWKVTGLWLEGRRSRWRATGPDSSRDDWDSGQCKHQTWNPMTSTRQEAIALFYWWNRDKNPTVEQKLKPLNGGRDKTPL
ncbi:hypothetical protein PAMP_022877 [Pampus punctatissimus]